MYKPRKLFFTLCLTLMLLLTGFFTNAQEDIDVDESSTKDLLKGFFEDTVDDALSGGLEPPTIIWPMSGREFSEYLGPLPLQWEEAEDAIKYDIEVDCKLCKDKRGWGDNRDEIWDHIRRIESTTHKLDLSGVSPDGPWKWRIRTRSEKKKSKWSKWSYFVFKNEEPIEQVEEVNIYEQNPESQDDNSDTSNQESIDSYDESQSENAVDDQNSEGQDDYVQSDDLASEEQIYDEDTSDQEPEETNYGEGDEGYSEYGDDEESDGDDYSNDDYGQNTEGTIEDGYNQD